MAKAKSRIFYTCVDWPQFPWHYGPDNNQESLEDFLNKKSREGMTLAFVGVTLIFTSSFVYP